MQLQVLESQEEFLDKYYKMIEPENKGQDVQEEFTVHRKFQKTLIITIWCKILICERIWHY